MRTFVVRLALVLASFVMGLGIFYVPEHRYRVSPAIWLPATNNLSAAETLRLPVESLDNQHGRVLFAGSFASSPQLIEQSASHQTTSTCPNVFNIASRDATDCHKIGQAGSIAVYGIVRQSDSLVVDAFMQRSSTILAVRGFYDMPTALAYMQSLVEVPERDVSAWLKSNSELVGAQVASIKTNRLAAHQKSSEAYKHLQFTPVLPTILPADWVQQVARIEGPDPAHPQTAAMYYKKGSQRLLSLTMVPALSVRLSDTCGPLPGTGEVIPCSKVSGQNYYSGGLNKDGALSWLIFRQMGDTMAILEVGAYTTTGQPARLSTQDLAAEQTMAASLTTVSRDRLAGAIFAGPRQDDFVEIQ